MPVPSSVVGLQTDPISHTIDNRWVMSYAAGLGDESPVQLDPTRPGGLLAHPLFPVCFEWPTVLAVRHLGPLHDAVSAAEARRAIHATHDLTITRLVVPGDVLRTVATVIGVQRRSPGAFLTMDMITTDAAGAEVCRTRQGSLYLGTDVQGPDRPAPPEAAMPELNAEPAHNETVAVGATAAHVYTECARIWNPIHTDLAVALDAGLPGLILHGTATLAHAVSVGVRQLGGGDPRTIRRIRGRFGAMVPMPGALTVRLDGNGRFDVCNAEGGLAVKAGFLDLA